LWNQLVIPGLDFNIEERLGNSRNVTCPVFPQGMELVQQFLGIFFLGAVRLFVGARDALCVGPGGASGSPRGQCGDSSPELLLGYHHFLTQGRNGF